MEVSVETCWKSLNKIHEELCGDKVEILKTEDSDVVILADGMVQVVSQATRLMGSCSSMASRIPSEIWSQILSG